MNIILDEAQVELMKQKHTVLELDTFRLMPAQQEVTAWCVVTNIPLMEMSLIDNHRRLHQELIENYQNRNWSFCEQAIEHLVGKWDGELDSFYQEVHSRVLKFKTNDPGAEWDGIIDRYA